MDVGNFLDKCECFFNRYDSLLAVITFIGVILIGFLLDKKAKKIRALLAWNQYRTPIKQFADDTINTLSKVEGLCELNPQMAGQQFWNIRNELISEISALRDKGKLTIPNVYSDSYGIRKPSAYREFREEALDCLSAAFYFTVAIDFKEFGYNKEKVIIKKSDERDFQLTKIQEGISRLPRLDESWSKADKSCSCKSGIVECKREFVSIIRELLESKFWNKEIKRLGKKILPIKKMNK